MPKGRGKKLFVFALGTGLLFSTTLVTILNLGDAVHRAIMGMGWGLILLWIFICGPLMYRSRDTVRALVQGIRLRWQVKFVAFATLLILVEEMITTGMTNLAPLFGVSAEQAHITASTNYFEVIFFHSVIVIAPMFIGWAVMLSYYDFSAFEVFLLFGITGTLAEANYGGPDAFGAFAMWIFVYGLMVWLPAYCVPQRGGLRQPRWWHYPLATVIPFLFVPLTGWIPDVLFPHHPAGWGPH